MSEANRDTNVEIIPTQVNFVTDIISVLILVNEISRRILTNLNVNKYKDLDSLSLPIDPNNLSEFVLDISDPYLDISDLDIKELPIKMVCEKIVDSLTEFTDLDFTRNFEYKMSSSLAGKNEIRRISEISEEIIEMLRQEYSNFMGDFEEVLDSSRARLSKISETIEKLVPSFVSKGLDRMAFGEEENDPDFSITLKFNKIDRLLRDTPNDFLSDKGGDFSLVPYVFMVSSVIHYFITEYVKYSTNTLGTSELN